VLKPTASRSHNSSTRQAAFCEPPVKRPHYFTGQILSADDFTAEQEYHIGKQRRHNLHCHGFGVVHGLKVSTLKKNARWTVVIEPGFAIDSAGNEIQLCMKVTFRLPESETTIQVGIRFSERLCDPVPIVSDATSLSSPSRAEEGCEVLLDPVSMPRGSRAKTGGLGTSLNVLPLAHLVRRGRVWQVSRTFKVPRAH
jgi:hypothetical protein